MPLFRPILFFLFAASPLVHAAPAWTGTLGPSALGPHPRLRPTSLQFDLSWKGMVNAGELSIDFAPRGVSKPGAFVIKSSAHSKGAAAKLFPYRHHFWSELHHSTLRPRYFEGNETNKKGTTKSIVRYFNDRVESHKSVTPLNGGKTSTTDRTFRFTRVHDLFSAMLHIRSQKLHAGQRINLVVQPFDSPYLLQVTSQGSTVHNGRKAIQLSIGMRKIDRDTLELKAYKKLKRNATMLLSDDADRIPIELRAAVFIGDVRATLTKHEKR